MNQRHDGRENETLLSYGVPQTTWLIISVADEVIGVNENRQHRTMEHGDVHTVPDEAL